MPNKTTTTRPRRRVHRISVKVPANFHRLVLDVPSVRHALETHERRILFHAAIRAIGEGLSLNRAARAIGKAPSWLSEMRKKHPEAGDSIFETRRHLAGRPSKSRKRRSHSTIISLLLPISE